LASRTTREGLGLGFDLGTSGLGLGLGLERKAKSLKNLKNLGLINTTRGTPWSRFALILFKLHEIW